MTGLTIDTSMLQSIAKRALDNTDTLSPLAKKTMAPMPSGLVAIERTVLGSSENVRGTLLNNLNAKTGDELNQLRAVEHFTPEDIDTLADLWLVQTDDDRQRSAQEGPNNRARFDPSSMSDIAALLRAISALNLARTVGAQMQGKFAELAFNAAVKQGAATVASARHEMNAALTGGLFAIGMAGAGAAMSFKGQALNHDSIKHNLVDAHALKSKAVDMRATLDAPVPLLGGSSVPSVNASPVRPAPKAKVDKAQADIERPRAEADARLDHAAPAERRMDQAQRRADIDVEDENRLLTPDERAVLGEPVRVMEERADALGIKHRLNSREIDGWLTAGQATMALAQIISNATSSAVRIQAAVESANSTIRATDSQVHKSLTEGQVQQLGETTSLINKLTDLADKRQRDDSDVVAAVAGVRA